MGDEKLYPPHELSEMFKRFDIDIDSEKSLGIRGVADPLKLLKSEGYKFGNFAIGDPIHTLPDVVFEDLEKDIQRASSVYPPFAGSPELKEVIPETAEKFFGLPKGYIKPKHCIPVTGIMQGTYLFFKTIKALDGRPIILEPDFAVYPRQCQSVGLSPYYVSRDAKQIVSAVHGWRDLMKNVHKENLNSVIFSDPNNPLGDVFDEERREQIRDIGRSENMIICHDFAYFLLIYDGTNYAEPGVTSPVMARKGIKTITLIGLSKTGGAPGQRIAAAIISPELYDEEIIFNGRRTTFGQFFTEEIYCSVATPPHHSQMAMKSFLSHLNEGHLVEHFKQVTRKNESRLRDINSLFERYGFERRGGKKLATLYSTFSHPDYVDSGLLQKELLVFGIGVADGKDFQARHCIRTAIKGLDDDYTTGDLEDGLRRFAEYRERAGKRHLYFNS